jgi:hypothetical protein
VSSERRSQGGGLSITTLLIAGASSAVAAFIVQTFWQRGTVFAAAMTPVIVALVTETLRKPVEAVSAVRVRRTPEGTALLDPVEPPPPDPAEPFDPLAPLPTEELEAALTGAPRPQRTEHRRRRLTGRQWKIGIATGLIAFLCVAAVVTASELAIFGDSVSNGDRRTTFFGGSHKSSSEKEKATPTPTPTDTAAPKKSATPTVTQTPTATPTATPTVTPSPQTVAPGATVAPAPSATPPP